MRLLELLETKRERPHRIHLQHPGQPPKKSNLGSTLTEWKIIWRPRKVTSLSRVTLDRRAFSANAKNSIQIVSLQEETSFKDFHLANCRFKDPLIAPRCYSKAKCAKHSLMFMSTWPIDTIVPTGQNLLQTLTHKSCNKNWNRKEQSK